MVSPLYHVAKNGFPDILKLFLDYGADINVEDEFEETPLDIAKSEKWTTPYPFYWIIIGTNIKIEKVLFMLIFLNRQIWCRPIA